MPKLKNKTLIEETTRSGYIFISDIHGTKNTIKLIKQARNDYPNYTLVGGGDYIDGRKDSKTVLDYLMHTKNAVLLRGNHEQMLLDFAEGRDDYVTGFSNEIEPLWLFNGGKTTLYSLFHKRINRRNYGEAKKLLLASPYYKWLKTLPIMYDTPYIIFVHGGVHPTADYADPSKYPGKDDPKDDNYDTYRLWAREEYWGKPGLIRDRDTGIVAKWTNMDMRYFRHNLTGKTIVTGHTPTALISGAYDDWSIKNKHCVLKKPFTRCPVLKVQYPGGEPRIFTDGGCHSSYSKHWGNVTVISSTGEIERIYNYENCGN